MKMLCTEQTAPDSCKYRYTRKLTSLLVMLIFSLCAARRPCGLPAGDGYNISSDPQSENGAASYAVTWYDGTLTFESNAPQSRGAAATESACQKCRAPCRQNIGLSEREQIILSVTVCIFMGSELLAASTEFDLQTFYS